MAILWLDFGDYIENVMNRISEGDKDYQARIACTYKSRTKMVMP